MKESFGLTWTNVFVVCVGLVMLLANRPPGECFGAQQKMMDRRVYGSLSFRAPLVVFGAILTAPGLLNAIF